LNPENPKGTKILIVDDDAVLVRLVASKLKNQGYEVIEAENGEMGLKQVRAEQPHLVVLDVMMPVMDGFEMLLRLREDGLQVPVIVLSAKGELEDRLEGLTLGADDYLPKPFDINELLLRIQAILRRSAPGYPAHSDGRFSDGYLQIELGEGRVIREGRSYWLTRFEIKLLNCLLRNAPQTVSTAELSAQIQKTGKPGSISALKVHISHLRRKLEPNPKKPIYLLTQRGEGYSFSLTRSAKSNYSVTAKE